MKKTSVNKASRRLIGYRLGDNPPTIRPGVVRRAWMDETPNRYAYRCLPLTIANSFGWEILSPVTFEATWNGGIGKNDVAINVVEGDGEVLTSHFGNGVLTFHVGYLFRTESTVSMLAMGPPNAPKDGIAPLAGIVETGWAPYPFTMNWKFTRPNHPVRFEIGEPFCFIMPVSIGLLETTRPEIADLRSDPQTQARFEEWSRSRSGFIADLNVEGSDAQAERWQKRYMRGLLPDGRPAPADHHSAVTVREFVDRTRG